MPEINEFEQNVRPLSYEELLELEDCEEISVNENLFLSLLRDRIRNGELVFA